MVTGGRYVLSAAQRIADVTVGGVRQAFSRTSQIAEKEHVPAALGRPSPDKVRLRVPIEQNVRRAVGDEERRSQEEAAEHIQDPASTAAHGSLFI